MGAVVFFAFILFVMGGVTAYMGDRLGSYIGKKRHSTFGLRPRHTAMLWTVVSGGAIAVGTLGLFLALNRTFSTALVRGPQLLETNRMLDKQNRTLTKHNLATERQAQADSRRAGEAQKRAKDAQAQADQAQTALGQVRSALGQVRSALGQAQSNLAQSKNTLAQRQAALMGAENQLSAARGNLTGTREQLAWAQKQVRTARLGVKNAQRQYQLAGREVLKVTKNVLALGIEQDTLLIKQDKLHAENDALVHRNQAQQSLLIASQGHPLIFRREEEVGRTVVSAGQPPEALRRELAVFLDQVELTARQRGAGDLDNSPAVVIPAPGAGADSSAEAREAVLDALSQSIAAQGSDQPSVVVVAGARYNTFKGEPVKLDLKPYANVVVFSQGTIIAVGALDGDQPDDVILKRLQAFLTSQVRTVALERGIIPVRDPQSGEPLVGQPIDTPTALALVKQIQQAGRDAHIIAAAAANTYSADLLRLDLRVTPAPGLPRTRAARQ